MIKKENVYIPELRMHVEVNPDESIKQVRERYLKQQQDKKDKLRAEVRRIKEKR